MSAKTKSQGSGNVPVPKMKRGLKGFFRDVVREMKHVTWPSPQETTRLTGVVLAVCAMLILLLWIASTVFAIVLREGFGGGV